MNAQQFMNQGISMVGNYAQKAKTHGSELISSATKSPMFKKAGLVGAGMAGISAVGILSYGYGKASAVKGAWDS